MTTPVSDADDGAEDDDDVTPDSGKVLPWS